MNPSKNLPNRPERHHYIPKFLLKKWYGSDDQLQYYTCKHRKLISDRTVAKSAGYQDHLYTPEIELKNMRIIDDDAAPVIEKILSAGIHNLIRVDQRAMAIFMASLLLRTPEALSKSNQLASFIAKKFTNEEPEHYKNFGLYPSVSLMYDEQIINDLINHTWKLIDFNDIPTDLILSDDPCGRIYDPSILAVPLSPKHAFFVIHKNNSNIIKKLLRLGKLEIVKILNIRSARSASKYIYAFDNKHENSIKKYLLWKKM